MDVRLVAFAIPVFLVAMLLEWLLNRRHLRKTGQVSATGGVGGYRLEDTLTDLGAGIGQQALDPLFRLVGVAAFVAVQAQFSLWQWDLKSPWQWFAAIVLVDLCFYWFHRASHRSNFFWAVHHVHHSSEEYNLAVALRQPWLEKLVDIPFYLPLALLGMPVEMYLGAFTIDLLYQFFIHTRWVPKLGPLEWILNTPSHHRVHHGVNPRYIDTNYGGIFIVFDRLFGTFVGEREPPVYGTVKPLQTWNAAWANTVVWTELAAASRLAHNRLDKLWFWFAPPEWRPSEMGGRVVIPEPDVAQRGWQGEDRPLARRFAVAALLSLVAILLTFLWIQTQLTIGDCALFAIGAVGLMASWGAGLDGKAWAWPVAWLSLAVLGVVWPVLVGFSPPVLALCGVVSVSLAALAWRLGSEARQAVQVAT